MIESQWNIAQIQVAGQSYVFKHNIDDSVSLQVCNYKVLEMHEGALWGMTHKMYITGDPLLFCFLEIAFTQMYGSSPDDERHGNPKSKEEGLCWACKLIVVT